MNDTEALAWIRKKLDLPDDTPMLAGKGPTIAGAMHIVCSAAHGYETYIKAFRCDDKQGEIARLTVEVGRLREALRVADAEAAELRRMIDGLGTRVAVQADLLRAKAEARP